MKKTIYTGNSKLSNIKYYSDTKIWIFQFDDIIFLSSSAFWRYFKDEKLSLISKDNDLKYSFEKPKINLEYDLLSELKNELLLSIKLNKNNDLILNFDNKKIIFYVSSTVFENWEITIKGKQYICLNDGEIAIFNN